MIDSIQKSKKVLIQFIRTKENSVPGVSNIYGVKLLYSLGLDFRQLMSTSLYITLDYNR